MKEGGPEESKRLQIALDATEKQLEYAKAHVATLEESVEVLARRCESQEKRSAIEAAVASAAEKEALRCQKLLQRKEIEMDVWKGDARKLEAELSRERRFRGRDQTASLRTMLDTLRALACKRFPLHFPPFLPSFSSLSPERTAVRIPFAWLTCFMHHTTVRGTK